MLGERKSACVLATKEEELTSDQLGWQWWWGGGVEDGTQVNHKSNIKANVYFSRFFGGRSKKKAGIWSR